MRQKLRYGGQSFTLHECQRMHLRALTLPCGQREECFMPPCRKLAGITPKITPPQQGEKVCPICGRVFKGRGKQTYCSPACRRKTGK